MGLEVLKENVPPQVFDKSGDKISRKRQATTPLSGSLNVNLSKKNRFNETELTKKNLRNILIQNIAPDNPVKPLPVGTCYENPIVISDESQADITYISSINDDATNELDVSSIRFQSNFREAIQDIKLSSQLVARQVDKQDDECSSFTSFEDSYAPNFSRAKISLPVLLNLKDYGGAGTKLELKDQNSSADAVDSSNILDSLFLGQDMINSGIHTELPSKRDGHAELKNKSDGHVKLKNKRDGHVELQNKSHIYTELENDSGILTELKNKSFTENFEEPEINESDYLNFDQLVED